VTAPAQVLTEAQWEFIRSQCEQLRDFLVDVDEWHIHLDASLQEISPRGALSLEYVNGSAFGRLRLFEFWSGLVGLVGAYFEPRCAECGCTQDEACLGGCHWGPVVDGVLYCSSCVPLEGSTS